MNVTTIVKQAWNEIRRQPVIGAVTLGGTALAIFLIMIVVMVNGIKTMGIAPESERGRMMHERHMALVAPDGNARGSSLLSYKMAKELFGDLESAEVTAIYGDSPTRATVRVKGQKPVSVDMRETDSNYWKVFDHSFVNGRAFTESEVTGSEKVAIIADDVARKLFGTTDCIGRDVWVNMFTQLRVVGVVKDVPTVTDMGYAGLWFPLQKRTLENEGEFGDMRVTILARDRGDFEKITDEVKRRKEVVNTRLKERELKISNHILPLDSEMIHYARYSNVGPDVEGIKRKQVMVYAILLLIPAINLSSMTHSRLRRRVSEMGVRRAFGCTRWRLVGEIVSENMIITAIGGALGLLISVVCAWLLADTLFVNHELANTATRVSVGMLLNWRTFGIAMGFCFVLNLLCSGLPALRAARVKPTEAIGGLHK